MQRNRQLQRSPPWCRAILVSRARFLRLLKRAGRICRGHVRRAQNERLLREHDDLVHNRLPPSASLSLMNSDSSDPLTKMQTTARRSTVTQKVDAAADRRSRLELCTARRPMVLVRPAHCGDASEMCGRVDIVRRSHPLFFTQVRVSPDIVSSESVPQVFLALFHGLLSSLGPHVCRGTQ